MAEHTDQLLDAVNRFTRRALTADEVYLFDLILCDNEIDRDGDCFSDAALAELQKRFVGVTGIFDHNPKSGNQAARIFRTEVCTDPVRTTRAGKPYRFLRANAYMVRTEGNADLIREIDAGIKKEVSISCAVSRQTCSICGANRLKQNCGHRKGKQYAGATCYTVLDGITDVYEWSFVAVPAQRGAGVTKTMGGGADGEKDAMRRELLEMSSLLDDMTDDLRREVVRLCGQQGDNACARALARTAMHLGIKELRTLRESLSAGRMAAGGAQLQPQQKTDAAEADAGNNPFRMNG
ncbi:MAG: hypothetical protein IK107_04495 [Oscillospiraceae bacterium]|nr:hypothetical protein [Oscillospiraceae bacterium]